MIAIKDSEYILRMYNYLFLFLFIYFCPLLYFNNLPNRADGTTFPVPRNTGEKRGKERAKAGDVVTFSYLNFAAKSGIPVDPKLLMTRHDVTWNDVLAGDGRPTREGKILIIFYIRPLHPLPCSLPFVIFTLYPS